MWIYGHYTGNTSVVYHAESKKSLTISKNEGSKANSEAEILWLSFQSCVMSVSLSSDSRRVSDGSFWRQLLHLVQLGLTKGQGHIDKNMAVKNQHLR